MKVFAGGVSQLPSNPQHATEPFVLTAQEWKAPAETDVNVPVGASVCPVASYPQHARVPSVLTPQEWNVPAETEANVPPGGVAWFAAFCPQQATRPLVCTPQVCWVPAATDVNVPGGGSAWPTSSYPQQATVPSRLHGARMDPPAEIDPETTPSVAELLERPSFLRTGATAADASTDSAASIPATRPRITRKVDEAGPAPSNVLVRAVPPSVGRSESTASATGGKTLRLGATYFVLVSQVNTPPPRTGELRGLAPGTPTWPDALGAGRETLGNERGVSMSSTPSADWRYGAGGTTVFAMIR